MSPIGSDGYDYAQMPIDWVVDNNAILVTKMDGEVLPNTQGYPCMVWVYNTSGGNFVKRISNLTFMTQPEDAAMNQVYLGEFADDCTGEVYSKPNSGVDVYKRQVVARAASVHDSRDGAPGGNAHVAFAGCVSRSVEIVHGVLLVHCAECCIVSIGEQCFAKPTPVFRLC